MIFKLTHMARRDARTIENFVLVDLSEVPGRTPPKVTEAEGSDADRILRALQAKPHSAAKIHEPNDHLRDNLGPLINRIARMRGTAIRQKQCGEYLYIWLASEDY